MPTIRLTICSLLILVVTVSGCSSNRVRDLFGRNKAGYVTLEELDQELDSQSQAPRIAAGPSQQSSETLVSQHNSTEKQLIDDREEDSSAIGNFVDSVVNRNSIDPDPFIDFDTTVESMETEVAAIIDDTSDQIPGIDFDSINEEMDVASQSAANAAEEFAEFVNQQADEATSTIATEMQKHDSAMTERFDELLTASEFPETDSPSAFAEEIVSSSQGGSVNPFAEFNDNFEERSLTETDFKRTVPVSFSETRPDTSNTDHLFEEAARRNEFRSRDQQSDDNFSWDNFVAQEQESPSLTLPDVTQHTSQTLEESNSTEFDSLLEIPVPAPAISIPGITAEPAAGSPADITAIEFPPADAPSTEIAMAPAPDFNESLADWDDLPFSDAELAGIEEAATMAAAESQQTPIAEKYSLLKSLSGKTWFLVIGGLLVAALLLFPERRRKSDNS